MVVSRKWFIIENILLNIKRIPHHRLIIECCNIKIWKIYCTFFSDGWEKCNDRKKIGKRSKKYFYSHNPIMMNRQNITNTLWYFLTFSILHNPLEVQYIGLVGKEHNLIDLSYHRLINKNVFVISCKNIPGILWSYTIKSINWWFKIFCL